MFLHFNHKGEFRGYSQRVPTWLFWPIWVYLGELGAKNLDWLHEQIQKGQLVIYILVGTLAVFLFWKWKKAKKSKAN